MTPRSSLRPLDVVIRIAIVGLTLGTAYIHSTLGGLLFTLNAVGYLVAAVAVVIPLGLAIRFRWFVRLGLMGYAATAIVAWAVQGPYYTTAFIAKGIEVALITLLAVDFARMDGNPVNVVKSELALLASKLGRRPATGRPAPDLRPAGPGCTGLRAATLSSTPRVHDTGACHTMKRILLALGLVALAAISAACSSASAQPDPVRPGRRERPDDRRQGHGVRPGSTVEVKAGTNVTLHFDNQDSAPHNVAIYTRQQRLAEDLGRRDRRRPARRTRSSRPSSRGHLLLPLRRPPRHDGDDRREVGRPAAPQPTNPGPRPGVLRFLPPRRVRTSLTDT